MIGSDIVVGAGLNITVSKDELAQRLAVVARGVSTRTAVLVLGGIQVRAEAARLHLAATDMELSLRASLEAGVSEEGGCCSTSHARFRVTRSRSSTGPRRPPCW